MDKYELMLRTSLTCPAPKPIFHAELSLPTRLDMCRLYHAIKRALYNGAIEQGSAIGEGEL